MASSLLTVAGTVFVREKVALPPGAVATVKLVDGEGEVLAGTAIEASTVPVEFSLAADPALASAPDELFVWAALRAGDVGVWGTTELVPVTGDATSVLLTKIED